MSERRLYPDRTALWIVDVKDQLPGKYIATIINAHGEKSAFTCDEVQIAPGMALFLRHQTVVPIGDKPKPIIVAACNIRESWSFVERDRFIEMTGEQNKIHEQEDTKAHNALMERLVGGKNAIVKLVPGPGGKVVPIPASEEEAAKYMEESSKEASKKPYEPGTGVYA